MNSETFQVNKLLRAIRTNGSKFTFARKVLDDFKEPTGRFSSYSVKALYHETTSYLGINRNNTEGSIVTQKPYPMILVSYEYINQIAIGDVVRIKNRVFEVNAIKDLTESAKIYDISLEEIQKNG